jgi:hypothetical protein
MMSLFSRSGTLLRAANKKRCLFVLVFSLFTFIPVKSYSGQASFSGDYEMRLINLGNTNVLNADADDNITYADLRFRLNSALEINENTKGVIALETGHTVFGIDHDSSSDEDVPGDDSIDLKLKSAYVDFILPHRTSNFIVGLQPFYIFDGLLANEDAFGVTYRVDADRKIQINYVKIDEGRVNDKYFNEDNPTRTSALLSMFYENKIFKYDTYNLLLGYYIDKGALISGITYKKRNAMYYGLGYRWEKSGFDYCLDMIYEKGRKKYVDELTSEDVSTKNVGYLVDFTMKKSFKSLDFSFEALLSTGDENKNDEKDREYMAIDGLTNFYDRAYILTGYITKDDADEKEGIFDTALYNLTNVVFFKFDWLFKVSEDKRLDLSVMYALNDKEITALSGRQEKDIGGEIDATFSIDLFDTYYQDKKGLLLNIFASYFVPGKNYEALDGTDADDVYLLGTGLEYIF